MALVWFVRRRGGQWIAPGGNPAFELPLARILFPLDLGTHRRLTGEQPMPAPELPAEDAADLQRVMIELSAADVAEREFSGYEAGFYDSSLAPRVAARRLAGVAGERS